MLSWKCLFSWGLSTRCQFVSFKFRLLFLFAFLDFLSGVSRLIDFITYDKAWSSNPHGQISNINNMIWRQSMEGGNYVQSYKFVGI